MTDAATGTLTNTAAVALPAGFTDPMPTNNSATDPDAVLPLTVAVAGAVATVGPEGDGTLAVTGIGLLRLLLAAAALIGVGAAMTGLRDRRSRPR